MLRKVNLLLFVSLLLTINGFAQSNMNDCGKKMIEKLAAQAEKSGLKVQGSYSFQSVDNGSMVTVPVFVDKNDKTSPQSVNRGRAVAFAYIESEKSTGLSNGFYFIQLPPDFARKLTEKAGKNSAIVDVRNATFISVDGRTVKDIPVEMIYYQAPFQGMLKKHFWTHMFGYWMDGDPFVG